MAGFLSFNLIVLMTLSSLVTLITGSPVVSSSIPSTPVLTKATSAQNAVKEALVYPRDRSRLDELDWEIRAIVGNRGEIDPLISNHVPEYMGIVFWWIKAEAAVIREIESRTNDVGQPLKQNFRPLVANMGAMDVDEMCSSRSYQTTISLGTIVSCKVIDVLSIVLIRRTPYPPFVKAFEI